MINLLLFFDDNKLKNHMNGLDGQSYTVVTPSPMHADMSRLFFDSQQKYDVITISNFIKTYTNEIFDDEIDLKLKRKSDLNLILASLWRIINKDSSYELFQKSFTLLTDFRAFSLNEDILTTILENYDEEISNSVLWFHRTIEQLDLIDEHKSYFMISEKLREGNLPILLESEKNYVFMGFDFLTPAQIDMIQSLAIRNNVYIPFNADVYKNSKDFDWIKWITKFDTNIIEVDSFNALIPELSYVSISKNYLSKALKEIDINEDDDIIICSKQVDQKMISEIPYANTKFKVQTDLLYKEISQIEEELVALVLKESIHKDDFSEVLQSMYSKAVEEQNFKYLKTVMLVKEIFCEWMDLTDKNEYISTFEIKVFMESLQLNTPRNSIINSVSSSINIENLNTLDKLTDSKRHYFCATSEYGPIKSSVIDYSEDVQKYLATIGPIRRSEFEFEILKNKLKSKLTHKNSQLLIESSIIKEDAGWSDILSEFSLVEKDVDLSKKRESKFSYFKDKSVNHEISHYSASRLQTYLDCPQKYWHNYILKQSKRITLQGSLNAMELGLIEHEVIEKYLINFNFYEEDQHEAVIKNYLLTQEKSFLSGLTLDRYLIEVKAFTQKTILNLLEIKNSFNMKFKFELSISNRINKAIGSIDCFGQSSEFNCLLDFKRGATSIPSQKGFYEFEKIQLWFYLNQIQFIDPDFLKKDFVVGYINLGEPEKSLIFASNNDLKAKLVSTGIDVFKKTTLLKDEFADLFEEYKEFESKTILKINSDSKFLAKPQNDLVCNFCDLKNMCQR